VWVSSYINALRGGRLAKSDRNEIEQAAIRLLASREHSRAELKRKLGVKADDPASLEQVLDNLQQQKLQSDERFVEQYVGSRKRKGYGPLRIRQELQRKGVEREEIDRWLQEGDPEWWDLLEQVAVRKFGTTAAADYAEKSKRARFLEYRGFLPEMIREYIWSD
jgi:regulatory protein